MNEGLLRIQVSGQVRPNANFNWSLIVSATARLTPLSRMTVGSFDDRPPARPRSPSATKATIASGMTATGMSVSFSNSLYC